MIPLETSRTWTIFPRPNPDAHLRLFCLPYAGGSTAVYHAWLDKAPPEIELCLVQLPGRGSRLKEEPFTRLLPLVEAISRAIHPYLDRPFAFFGHSMGALLGFELARRLRRQHGLHPAHLFVSAYRAPQIDQREPHCHPLPEAEFLQEVSRRYDGIPDAIRQEPELLQLLLPVLRADMAVCETYEYRQESPLDCAMTALGGEQDRRVNREELTAWSQETRGAFRLHTFPGDHFYLQANPALPLTVVADTLGRRPDHMLRGVRP